MTDVPVIKSRALSMDEITSLITDVAVNGEGADKFRALKMLSAQKAQDAIIPEPLDEAEIIARMARLMTGAGLSVTRLAYFKAFSHRTRTARIKAQLEAFTPGGSGLPQHYPRTLRALYKKHPQLKRKGGLPRGYPAMGSELAKEEWIKRECMKIEMEEQYKQQKEAVLHMEGRDAEDKSPGDERRGDDPLPGQDDPEGGAPPLPDLEH